MEGKLRFKPEGTGGGVWFIDYHDNWPKSIKLLVKDGTTLKGNIWNGADVNFEIVEEYVEQPESIHCNRGDMVKFGKIVKAKEHTHIYSKSMYQDFPRKCTICGELEEQRTIPVICVETEKERTIPIFTSGPDSLSQIIKTKEAAENFLSQLKSLNEDKPETKVTRFEVIDEYGRQFVRYGVNVELSYQDDGRTLKVFLTDKK